MTDRKINRALISVYDKTGIVDFARTLINEFGIEIISTGGTAKLLAENNIPVTLVESITGWGEMLDGRVKTLHPKIHAAILADRDNPKHVQQLKDAGINPIDMVVVNLYPFEKTVANPDCKFDDAIEMIDIGGPCMLRAAAKNHRHVVVVPSAAAFGEVLDDLRTHGDVTDLSRRILAARVFDRCMVYNQTIEIYLTGHCMDASDTAQEKPAEDASKAESSPFARMSERLDQLSVDLYRGAQRNLRYGENPTQQACAIDYAFDGAARDDIPGGDDEQTGSIALSYNNSVDADAAIQLCSELHREFGRPLGESGHVGPAFQPVFPRITHEQHTERHLPHIQNPGATYFITFRLHEGSLDPRERSVVLDACKHWHTTKMTVHACVVMPDHVHLLVTPHEVQSGEWVALGEIVKSIKGYSARIINEHRGSKGALWLDETWDRIVRDEQEFGTRWEYIESNPARAELGQQYEWVWMNHASWKDLHEYNRRFRPDRLESRSHIAEQTHSVVFIKHTNACGVGTSSDPLEAYRRAYLGDPNAAMGGILACSFPIDAVFADAVMNSLDRWGRDAGAGAFFAEVWAAPSFNDDAPSIIRTAKPWGERVRLLAVGDMTTPPDADVLELRSIAGGILMQTPDVTGLNEDAWKVVTQRAPSDQEMNDLRLAWLTCKHTKSNAISICKDGMLIGNGAGQMSRVMSCRIATWLANENGHADKLAGAAAASDAFFPFRDGPDILIDAGITAIIQPGGSKRDEDTIAACNERNIAMIVTGTRHFKH
ncbi:MAG: transposase [Phycisphaerales bacterium]|nr:transposase [Phycisphaerales bacterium]